MECYSLSSTGDVGNISGMYRKKTTSGGDTIAVQNFKKHAIQPFKSVPKRKRAKIVRLFLTHKNRTKRELFFCGDDLGGHGKTKKPR